MFLSDDKVFELIKKYGSPLYVYDERILRKSCREMHNLLPKKNLRVNYSAKANSNIEILKIVRDEDIDVDAMSPGEIMCRNLQATMRIESFILATMYQRRKCSTLLMKRF